MLYLFLATVFHSFWLTTTTWWKLHVINQLGNSFTVGVVQNVADYALQEGFVLKLDMFLLVFISFFMFGETRVVLCFLRFGFWFRSDEAVQICLGSVEFQGKIILFEHFAHKFHTIICNKWYTIKYDLLNNRILLFLEKLSLKYNKFVKRQLWQRLISQKIIFDCLITQ